MVKSADKLVGKKVVVVGGTSGIGFGVAQAFLDAGAKVVVISSNQERVNEAVRRLASPDVSGAVGNVREEESFVQVLRDQAPVDHIIFSGVDKIIRGKLEDLNLDDAKYLFGVKFWGSLTVGKAVKKYDIIRPGGSLTLTSGTAALKPGKGASAGGALNGGVISLTKGLAGDLAEKKIRVNVVTPGLVKTELWDKLGKTPDEQKKLFEETNLPVGFVATPDDIAEAYLFLAKADYATGISVEIGKFMAVPDSFDESGVGWEVNAKYISTLNLQINFLAKWPITFQLLRAVRTNSIEKGGKYINIPN